MRSDASARLRCPVTLGPLDLIDAVSAGGDIRSGTLRAGAMAYPIVDGIPDFVSPVTLTPQEATIRADYDRVAASIYDAALEWQFKAFYEDEHRVRELMIDQLRLQTDAAVLEVGCGTGRDSFRIAQRLGAGGSLHLQDLSGGMVHECARRMAARSDVHCQLEYSVSNATHLPFADSTFDAVFHFGGFNQFGDLAAAAAELTRVVKVGGRVVVGDEAVAPWLRDSEFAGIVTTNNPLFAAPTPLESLPPCAREVSVQWIIANCFYVIAFTKGEGVPPLDLDLPHQGWRGGTMRSRYFGLLEGVSPETKALTRTAAAEAGMSVHDWLEQTIRTAARKVD